MEFIQGVTVISEQTVKGSGWVALIAVAVLIETTCRFKDIFRDWKRISLILKLIATVTFVCWFLFIGILACAGLYAQVNPATEYLVEVEDNVSFNEFYDHYDIIMKESDKTYWIKAKD